MRLHCTVGPVLHYSINFWIQTYTELVPLKYGNRFCDMHKMYDNLQKIGHQHQHINIKKHRQEQTMAHLLEEITGLSTQLYIRSTGFHNLFAIFQYLLKGCYSMQILLQDATKASVSAHEKKDKTYTGRIGDC